MSCPQGDLIMAMCLYYDIQHHSGKEIPIAQSQSRTWETE